MYKFSHQVQLVKCCLFDGSSPSFSELGGCCPFGASVHCTYAYLHPSPPQCLLASGCGLEIPTPPALAVLALQPFPGPDVLGHDPPMSLSLLLSAVCAEG